MREKDETVIGTIKFRNGSTLFQFLGLPVTIAHAGLVPFLVSFLIGFFVQVSNTWPQRTLILLKDGHGLRFISFVSYITLFL